jgi:hypothetical protein
LCLGAKSGFREQAPAEQIGFLGKTLFFEKAMSETLTERRDIAEQPRKTFRESLWRSFILALLAGLTLLACFLFRDIDTKTEPGVLMNLPDSIGSYLGFDTDITEGERHILPQDTEFAKKRYDGFNMSEITTEIVLSGAQRQSIHRPQVCLVGQGWTIQTEETIPITLTGLRVQKVRKLTLVKSEDGKQFMGYFIYWFIGKDKTTDDHLERIFLTSWDRIVHRINHRWAYVIVSSILDPSLKVTEQEKRQVLTDLVSFTGQIIPMIQKPQVNGAGFDAAKQ